MSLSACGDGGHPEAEVQLVGIDFQLNSVILTNAGSDDLQTTDVWIYQDGDAFQLGIFTIEPRATILFSVRDLGGIDPSGGEIALYNNDNFDDPNAIFDYVVWGNGGFDRIDTAMEGGVWNDAGPVDVESDTLVVLRADSELNGPDAWVAGSVIP